MEIDVLDALRGEPAATVVVSDRPCRAAAFSVAGGPAHCAHCCPPPPLSPEQIARVAAIVAEVVRARM